MKNKIIALSLVVLSVFLFAFQREQIVSYAETSTTTILDTTAPQLNSVSISPSTVIVNSNFKIRVSATDDSSGISSVAIKIIGPSSSDINQITANITAADSEGYWSAELLMPANSENGTWKVAKIVLTDVSENVKEYYYGNNLTTTFTVSGNTTTNCTGRTILDSQNKYNCVESKGSWNSLTCTCTCPTNYYLGGGGSCVYKTTSTTTTGTTSTTSGTTSTTTTGTTSSTTTETTSSNDDTASTSTTTVATNCSTSITLNDQNKNNCTWSSGVWDSSTCTCTCPTAYYLSNAGSCVYGIITSTCESTANSGYCTNSGGSWNATSCTCTCPTGYYLKDSKCVIESTSTIDRICTSEDYSEWSKCQSSGTQITGTQITGTQTRTLLNNCVSNLPLTQSCTYIADTTTCVGTGSTDCYGSGGSWSATACACTCPTGYYLKGTSCVINQVIATSCSTSSILNEQNKNNCTWSKGTWNSTTCICTCPTSYYLSTAGSCVYKKVSTCSSTGTDCTDSGGKWNSTTCACTCPTNYHLDNNKCVADLSITCTKDEWSYGEWSVCVNGKQYRTSKLVFDCPGTSTIPQKTEQACADNEIKTDSTSCYYKFSEYGSCINGKQTRKLLDSYPEGCSDKLTEPLEKTCVAVSCSYKYSEWGECKDGKKTRNVTSTYPEGCTPGSPEIETNCKSICSDNDWKCEDWSSCGSEGYQYRKCSMSQDCTLSTSLVLKSPLTTRTCLYAPVATETETTGEVAIEEQLPEDCLKIGWKNKNDCELYLYYSRTVSDCRDNGITAQNECRDYLLNKYGKPLKCQGVSDESCNALINNIILSDLKSVVTDEVKEKLVEVAGQSATIDVQSQTIKVETVKTPIAGGQSTTQIKEVKIDNLPITSSTSEQVSVSLISTETKNDQQNLSPVAISFDADGDGLPDDMENRLGTNPNNKDTDNDGYTDDQELRMGTDPLDSSAKKTNVVLSGIDKALVDGKTLGQPKYVNSVTSASLAVDSVATVKSESDTNKNNLKFEGKAQPNQVITLYIYSTMPIVVTVQADANGNWTYELDKTMVDGTHEVYVAVNNNEGEIVEASLPTPFFIQEAQAVSIDNFVAMGDASQAIDQTNNMMTLYIFTGLAIILVLIAAFLMVKKRLSSEE